MERAHRKWQNVLLSNNFFHSNILILFKVQTALKCHYLTIGASALAILMLFSFLAFVKL